jgi:hypothetical protein
LFSVINLASLGVLGGSKSIIERSDSIRNRENIYATCFLL